MAKGKLVYEDVKITIVALQTNDMITTSFVTNNVEDVEEDFFTPVFK